MVTVQNFDVIYDSIHIVDLLLQNILYYKYIIIELYIFHVILLLSIKR
jgi:hypothetical protein